MKLLNRQLIEFFLMDGKSYYALQIANQLTLPLNGIYTTLHRMEQQRIIVSQWGSSHGAARRKYYKLRK